MTQNTDGKFVLQNGLKICWGIASTTNGLSTIIFPVTFQNNPIVNAIMTGMTVNNSLIVPMIQSISKSEAEIRLTYYNGQWLGGAGENIAWIAIGY